MKTLLLDVRCMLEADIWTLERIGRPTFRTRGSKLFYYCSCPEGMGVMSYVLTIFGIEIYWSSAG